MNKITLETLVYTFVIFVDFCKCSTTRCALVPSSKGLSLVYSSTLLQPGVTARFYCNGGYTLVGNALIECQTNGFWSSSIPYCRRKATCPSIIPSYGMMIRYQRTEGVFLHPRSIATFSCHRGYSLEGASSMVCQDNGQWEGSQPRCNRISCPRIGTVSGMLVHYTNSLLQPRTMASIQCRPSYRLEGLSQLVCQQNGQWNGPLPICQLVRVCDRLEPKPGMIIEYQFTMFLHPGTEASISCQDKFKLVGDSLITCTDGGRWSKPLPECKPPKTCPYLEPSNAIAITYSEYSLVSGTQAIFACYFGYRLNGPERITCGAGGQWNSNAPTCGRPSSCSLHTASSGMSISYSDSRLYPGTIGSFHCFSPYELVGDRTLRCLDSGNWNKERPTCEAAHMCPAHTAMTGMSIRYSRGTSLPGTYAIFSCAQGFDLIGYARINCQNDGQWDKQQPTCQQKNRCVRYQAAYGMSIHYSDPRLLPNTVATFSCDSYMTLIGSPQLVCMENGQWNDIPPSCRHRSKE